MARNAETLTRKNNKLEAFLKKNLDADTFEKLRTYDACIVCSEKEDKAYKYVVVTDEWIYLTENPPKKIYETVHFSDVTSVLLVSGFGFAMNLNDDCMVFSEPLPFALSTKYISSRVVYHSEKKLNDSLLKKEIVCPIFHIFLYKSIKIEL